VSVALEAVVAIATVVALETLVDGWTSIEVERFREYLSVPECAAFRGTGPLLIGWSVQKYSGSA